MAVTADVLSMTALGFPYRDKFQVIRLPQAHTGGHPLEYLRLSPVYFFAFLAGLSGIFHSTFTEIGLST